MRLYGVLFLSIFLVGCSTVDITNYDGTKPKLDLFTYFQGETRGWGIVQNRTGKVVRQFVVDIEGTMPQPDTVVLEEFFTWRDGEKSQRTWTIVKTSANAFKGSADDVVGEANGSSFGNVLNWKYYLNIEVGGTKRKIHLDDWMFMQEDNVLINRTAMSKWGIHLGDITIVFNKTVP